MTTKPSLNLNLHADGLAAVSLARSTQETRYYLQGVYVAPWVADGVSGVMMMATDGIILATYFDRDGEADRSAIISCNFSSTLLKTGRSERTPRRLLVNGEVGRVMSVPRRKNSAEPAGLTLIGEIDGTFPDMSKVLALPSASASANFTWSHLVMDRVCKLAQRVNGPMAREVNVYMPERNGPTLFTFGSSCPLSVVAMPMRTGEDAKQALGWKAVSGEVIASVKQDRDAIAAE